MRNGEERTGPGSAVASSPSRPAVSPAKRPMVFDLYGTLLDTDSVVAACERRFPGRGADLSRLWRQRQLEHSWLRTAMGRFVDFDAVTREALLYAVRALGLGAVDAATVESLAGEYAHLKPFAEVPATLERLSPAYRLAVLSNGAERMLRLALEAAGLADRFEVLLSVDRVKKYKPSPEVYALPTTWFQVAASQCVFVSANWWDVAGAKSFGLTAVWVNRRGDSPDELSGPADGEVRSLEGLEHLRLP
jgi:2-haloacid dehalogenase